MQNLTKIKNKATRVKFRITVLDLISTLLLPGITIIIIISYGFVRITAYRFYVDTSQMEVLSQYYLNSAQKP